MSANFNVLVFASGSGTNLEALIQWQGSDYRVAAVFCDRPCRSAQLAQENKIPLIYNDFRAFFHESGVNDTKDYQTRYTYDKETVRLIREWERQQRQTVDLIVLAGYMRMLYPPLLEAFPGQIINVHPADLSVLTEEGKRKYVGCNSVYGALSQGESRTRSTVHFVNAEMDGGNILCFGPWVDYSGPQAPTQESARQHQEKQKRQSDQAALLEAIEGLAKAKQDSNKPVKNLSPREEAPCVV